MSVVYVNRTEYQQLSSLLAGMGVKYEKWGPDTIAGGMVICADVLNLNRTYAVLTTQPHRVEVWYLLSPPRYVPPNVVYVGYPRGLYIALGALGIALVAAASWHFGRRGLKNYFLKPYLLSLAFGGAEFGFIVANGGIYNIYTLSFIVSIVIPPTFYYLGRTKFFLIPPSRKSHR
ncbi:MAG: hypothetical protein ABWJ97_08505 [Thermoproteus sp.]